MNRVIFLILVFLIFLIRFQNLYLDLEFVDIDTLGIILKNIELLGQELDIYSAQNITRFTFISIYKLVVILSLIYVLMALYSSKHLGKKSLYVVFYTISILLMELIVIEISNYYLYGIFNFHTRYLAATALENYYFFVIDLVLYPALVVILFSSITFQIFRNKGTE